MFDKVSKWFRQRYSNTVNSIAFYPALIAIGFLVLSYAALLLDFSDIGKNIKQNWDFISLQDASTARSIATTIAAGILSLTVFSFSMVMILLNQAASNMSNRILDSMIGNRFQQAVLGFYIGTIVYALFLLSTIRDIDSGIYIPALSIYLLILLTVIDIFLFIYFLHYITQSVKYQTIIERLHRETRNALEHCDRSNPEEDDSEIRFPDLSGKEIKLKVGNYFQGFDEKSLVHFCEENDLLISFPYTIGTYLLAGSTYMVVQSNEEITSEKIDTLKVLVDLHAGQPIKKNPYYGFEQLTEVALKALSPGINDPGTAVLSLHVLADLLTYQQEFHPRTVLRDSKGQVRIVARRPSFTALIENFLLPIWDYGKNDRVLRQEMHRMLEQLVTALNKVEDQVPVVKLLELVKQAVRQNSLNSLSYSRPD
ncbi:DUF2254 domain-containing protein [Telluribacter sp.]|jgi:uncharacterized membrane protein|uniref:DUF2254 domain-containing protein n=1 Tax=Telluribacter sp. TaxID=1978767 RepID=UPI002E11E023|nr:DUF2254 domain-containing protein [Telluribacter sp.]